MSQPLRRRTDLFRRLGRRAWRWWRHDAGRRAVGGFLILFVSAVAGIAANQFAATRAGELAGQAKAQSQRLEMVAKEAGSAAQQATAIALAIQTQRLANIRDLCEGQNVRHDRTVRALDFVIRRALRHRMPRARRIEIRASRASTVLIINALAPYQDCRRVVARAQQSH